MKLNEKVDIYNKLLAALAKGVKLAAILNEKSDAANYTAALKKNDELANLAKKLREQIGKDWKIGAAKVLSEIRSSSGKLQSQIGAIEKTIGTGQKVVTALGYVVDLIAVARAVAGAIA